MPAAAFKAKCLRVMDEVEKKRVTVLITKKGRPMARLVPADEAPRQVLGCLHGRLQILGDIVAPVAAPDDREAAR